MGSPCAAAVWEQVWQPTKCWELGVRACLIHDVYSAHQGVGDDDMKVICLGGRVVGHELAWDLIQAFLSARYLGKERFQRRLMKIAALERQPQG